MKKQNKTKLRLLKEAYEMATNLHQVGALDETTMHEFKTLCLPKIKILPPKVIQSIRIKKTGSF